MPHRAREWEIRSGKSRPSLLKREGRRKAPLLREILRGEKLVFLQRERDRRRPKERGTST